MQTGLGASNAQTRSNRRKVVLSMATPDSTSNQPLKRCSKCGEEKPLSEFSPNIYTKSGYQSACKLCRNKTSEGVRRIKGQKPKKNPVINGEKHCITCGKKHPNTIEYFYANKSAKGGIGNICISCHLKNARDWYLNHPEQAKNTQRIYYSNNKASIIAYQLDWSRKNPDKRKKYVGKYLKLNPSAVRIYNSSRRARRKFLPDTLTISEWKTCLEWWGHKCAYCGKPQGLFKHNKIAAEHYYPLTSKDCTGTVAENIIPACTSCNSSKSNSDPVCWVIDTFGKRKGKEIINTVHSYFSWVREKRGNN